MYKVHPVPDMPVMRAFKVDNCPPSPTVPVPNSKA